MKFLILIFLSFLSISIKADDNKVFSETLKNNSLIKQYYYNYQQSKYNSKVELSEYLPEINATYNNYKNKYDKTSNNLEDSYAVKDYGLSIEQKIYELGAVKKLEAAKLKIRQIKLSLDNLISNLFLKVISLSLDIKLKESEYIFLKAKLELLEEVKITSKIKFENGSTTKLDFLQAQTEYLKLQSELIKNQKETKILKQNYFKITGISYLGADFTGNDIKIGSFENLQSEIKQNNLELKIFKLDNKIVKLKTDISYKNIAPSADLYIDYNRSNGGFSYMNNSTDTNSNIIYGVKVTIPLFKSGGNVANIKSAKQEYTANSYYLEDKVKQLDHDVFTLWQEITFAKELIKTQKSYLKYTGKTLEVAESNYNYGKTDLLDLLRAQNLDLEAKYELVKAKNLLIISKYKYLQLKGELLMDYFKIKLDSISKKY